MNGINCQKKQYVQSIHTFMDICENIDLKTGPDQAPTPCYPSGNGNTLQKHGERSHKEPVEDHRSWACGWRLNKLKYTNVSLLIPGKNTIK